MGQLKRLFNGKSNAFFNTKQAQGITIKGGTSMNEDFVINWLSVLLKASSPAKLSDAITIIPEVGIVASKIKEVFSQELSGTNFFYKKRNLVQSIIQIFRERHERLKSNSAYEAFGGEEWKIGEVIEKGERLLNLDFLDFIEGLALGTNEAELSDLLDLTPERFKGEIWYCWEKLPPFSDDPISFRIETIKKAKEVIWQAANITADKRGFSPSPSGFKKWLEGIPLLTVEFITLIFEDYSEQGYCYDNFDDVMTWSEEVFYDSALNDIRAWLAKFTIEPGVRV